MTFWFIISSTVINPSSSAASDTLIWKIDRLIPSPVLEPSKAMSVYFYLFSLEITFKFMMYGHEDLSLSSDRLTHKNVVFFLSSGKYKWYFFN